jgi:hypothetical protein
MTETQFEDLPEGKWGSLPTWVTSHIYRGILSQVVEEKGRPVFEPAITPSQCYQKGLGDRNI